MRSNPPRKNDHSYGDAIVWEAILEYAIDKDLVLITRDNDYIEKFGGEDDLHTFLKDEWSRKTKKKIKFYKSLGQFINDFEKQPKVKEEIVQKETEKPIVQGFYDIPVSSISSTSFLNPSNTFLNQAYTTVSASSLINSDTIGFSSTVINAGIYCPYCKTKVSDNLYSVYKPIVIRYGKQYKCPNSMCLKEFSIN